MAYNAWTKTFLKMLIKGESLSEPMLLKKLVGTNALCGWSLIITTK